VELNLYPQVLKGMSMIRIDFISLSTFSRSCSLRWLPLSRYGNWSRRTFCWSEISRHRFILTVC